MMDSYTVGRKNENMAETETKQKNPVQWEEHSAENGNYPVPACIHCLCHHNDTE